MGAICSGGNESLDLPRRDHYKSISVSSYKGPDPKSMRSSGILDLEDESNPNAEFFEKLILSSSMTQGYEDALSSIERFKPIKVKQI